MPKHNGKSGRKNGRLLRKDADRHQLYQWSVQSPDFEVEFMDAVFRKRRNRRPSLLREDFCGTALLSCTWVEGRSGRKAISLDLDHETLVWAKAHNLKPLGRGRRSVQLLEQDVRSVTSPRADIVCAYNFSYFTFHKQAELIRYFTDVRRSLTNDGLFFMDCYGGWESQQVMEEQRKISSPEGRFTYVWEQASFNPIDNRTECHIHFEFAKGKRWRKAFTYIWRLYSPAEVREALLGAGFAAAHIYWDRSKRDDEDDYRLAKRAKNAPGWLAYIVGEV